MIQDILHEFNLPEATGAVYERLLENGPSSARRIAENLNLPRPSVYDNLKVLIGLDLVSEREEGGKKVFQASDTKNLTRLISEKIFDLQKKEKEIKNLVANWPAKNKNIEPQIKFYPGVEGVKKILKDMLWYENIETLTMWPIKDMVEILGQQYLWDLNRRRIRQKISIRGIWPRDKTVDIKSYPFLGVGTGHLRQLRLAPKGMTWNMSYWLYADKVVFISSQAESFGFMVNSRDFVELIKVQFEQIWKISQPIKAQPKYTNEFLKSV